MFTNNRLWVDRPEASFTSSGTTSWLLADRRLPDGLSVSIQSGLKHAPDGMTDALKVWEKFIAELRSEIIPHSARQVMRS